MLFGPALIVLLGVFLKWLHSSYHSIWKHIAKIPGPPTLPLVGNLHMYKSDPAELLLTLRRGFKDYKVCRVYAGPKPIIFCLDPKSCEAVLSGRLDTIKKDVYDFFKPWFGESPFTANGALWKVHRNLVIASVKREDLSVINKCTRRFCTFLETFADSGEIIDAQELVPLVSFDIISELTFGVEFKTSEGKHSPLIKAIDDMGEIVTARYCSIFKRSDVFFLFSKDYRRQRATLEILRQELQKVLDERRKQLSSNSDLGDGIKLYLDFLCTAVIDGKHLSDREIIELMTAALFGGHHTLIAPISFAMFCLSRHPEVQEKAFQEQFQLFGKNEELDVTVEDSKEMPYLDMIIKETLRLFPSGPFIMRTTNECGDIGGYFVPKGVMIIVAIMALAADEQNFKDPFKFLPERFDTKAREQAKPYDYLPFSGGPRGCPGQKLALQEIRTCLSKLLRKFEMLPPVAGLSSGIHDPNDNIDHSKEPYQLRLVVNPALKSTNGVHVRLRRRIY